ncbi:MAG: Na+/H+ antiporter NhaC family protein [Bacillota bacterium]|nr:Na+/H+ antiporter NhaC family protein [Bacillota bacterium]
MEKNFTGRQVVALISVTLMGIVASVAFSIPLAIGFLPGLITLIFLVRMKNHSFALIWQVGKAGISRAKTVIFILFFVGFLLPSWYEAGTINQLVSLSLRMIIPSHFLLVSFLISSVFSMMLGTSVGTLSSIGIPIIGTAAALHLPLDMVAGALISGAFVGDRTSPISSSHQLLSNIVEVEVKKQFQAMLVTSIAAVAAGCVFYWVLDTSLHPAKMIHTNSIMGRKGTDFVAFLPPAILIGAVLLRFKIIYAFMGSILTACVVTFLNGISAMVLFKTLLFGVTGLGGGLKNMYLLLIFLALAGIYNGLLEEYQVIQPLLDKWINSSSMLAMDTVKLVLATLGISMLSGNQTLPIILTGRSFLPHWSSKHGKEELARVMADSTMLFPAMIPWSVLAIMGSTILGVSLYNYLPYAIFLWILPVLTIVISSFKQVKTPSARVSKTG